MFPMPPEMLIPLIPPALSPGLKPLRPIGEPPIPSREPLPIYWFSGELMFMLGEFMLFMLPIGLRFETFSERLANP